MCDYSVASGLTVVEAFVTEHHIDPGPCAVDEPTLEPRGALASYSRSLHLLLIVAIAFAQYLRKPVLIGASQLFKEGAGVLFAHHYHGAEHFFIYYMGSVSVGPNLLG